MDIEAKIVRVECGGKGTFGVILLNGEAFCVTLEPPWRGNMPNISSIPSLDQVPFLVQTGRYICKLTPSPLIDRITKGVWKAGYVLQNVPGRFGVMIHAGNFIENTHGCILLGQYFGKLRGDRAVLNTGETFNEFMTITRTVEQFPLTILDAI